MGFLNSRLTPPFLFPWLRRWLPSFHVFIANCSEVVHPSTIEQYWTYSYVIQYLFTPLNHEPICRCLLMHHAAPVLQAAESFPNTLCAACPWLSVFTNLLQIEPTQTLQLHTMSKPRQHGKSLGWSRQASKQPIQQQQIFRSQPNPATSPFSPAFSMSFLRSHDSNLVVAKPSVVTVVIHRDSSSKGDGGWLQTAISVTSQPIHG